MKQLHRAAHAAPTFTERTRTRTRQRAGHREAVIAVSVEYRRWLMVGLGLVGFSVPLLLFASSERDPATATIIGGIGGALGAVGFGSLLGARELLRRADTYDGADIEEAAVVEEYAPVVEPGRAVPLNDGDRVTVRLPDQIVSGATVPGDWLLQMQERGADNGPVRDSLSGPAYVAIIRALILAGYVNPAGGRGYRWTQEGEGWLMALTATGSPHPHS